MGMRFSCGGNWQSKVGNEPNVDHNVNSCVAC